ncbi:MAG: hypothetical protein LAP85_05905 [Acidobacteriia bacterium]|nr:hypothetical protein [Terriglobia bacterium]
MIDFFNSVLGRFFDAVFYPFRDLNSWIAMITISLLTALLMLFVYRLTSDQIGIRSVKDKIVAHLLEIRLYKNSMPVTFGAQGKILWYNLKYLGHSLRPMLVMIVPIVLMLLQLDLWFGYASLQPGDSAIVKVLLKEGYRPSAERVGIKSSTGLVVETPPLRIDSDGEVDWRVRATEPGARDLAVTVNDQTVTKQIMVGGEPFAKISPARVAPNWFDQLANPGESVLSDSSAVKRIEVGYRGLRMNLFGWRLHWLIVYFAFSIIIGLALKGLFKVEV